MQFLPAFLCLLLAAASAHAQVRGMSEQQSAGRKPDLTAGGGNSSVGATRPSLPEDKKERFAALDLDGDGRVSLAEAAGHEEIVKHFDRADRNRDGKLTAAEYDNLGKAPPKRRAKATGRTARGSASTSGTRAASMP
ncbi:MAG TPA: hypothetical protein VG873_17275 [Burkholderiales bacterium]|nr:hypothetical protein [Burkholderiales bacterium]